MAPLAGLLAYAFGASILFHFTPILVALVVASQYGYAVLSRRGPSREITQPNVSPIETEEDPRPTILRIQSAREQSESAELALPDYQSIVARRPEEAIRILRSRQVDLILLDLHLPKLEGLDVLRQIRAFDEDVQVIVMTSEPSVESSVAAMRLGAFDYLLKPVEERALLTTVGEAIRTRSLNRRIGLLRSDVEEELIGRHPTTQQLRALIAQAALTHVPVLIAGESGSGKGTIAHSIHRRGHRAEGPLVTVNLSAIPENLIETQLFGHPRKDSSYPHRGRGLIAIADRGTLFLSHIEALPEELQARLLRFLETKELSEHGDLPNDKRVNVRIIAGTSAPLEDYVRQGQFYERLYLSLNSFRIDVPPLRERGEDIPLFVDYFIKRSNKEYRKDIHGISSEGLRALEAYPWPGNVRELRQVIDRAVLLSEGSLISLTDLGLDFGLRIRRTRLSETMEEVERRVILSTLEQSGWNKRKAAEILGLDQSSLSQKFKNR